MARNPKAVPVKNEAMRKFLEEVWRRCPNTTWVKMYWHVCKVMPMEVLTLCTPGAQPDSFALLNNFLRAADDLGMDVAPCLRSTLEKEFDDVLNQMASAELMRMAGHHDE